MRSKDIARPLQFAAAIGDGNTLHSFRYASDGHAPTLYYKCTQSGLVVVSEPLDRDEASDWIEIPDASVLSFSSSDADGPELANFRPVPLGLAAE